MQGRCAQETGMAEICRAAKRAMAALVAVAAAVVSSPAWAQDSALVLAARDGDAKRIAAALAEGEDVNATTSDGSTALIWAVRADSPAATDVLLDAGADVRVATRHNVTPLAVAAANGSAAIVERLLAHGADPNERSEEGQTALMLAARNGAVDAVALLLARGADANAVEPFRGQTALMWAAGAGNADALRALLDAGAEIEARSRSGFTALLFAVRNAELDALSALIEHGADVDAIAPDGTSALNVAVVNGYYEVGSVLLDHGANPNLPDPRGSPLHTIAWLRKPGATGDAAVGGEADPPVTPIGRVTSLELVRQLLDHGANPNTRIAWEERRFGKEGGTARNPPDITLGRHLLTYVGATAFYIAAKNGDAELMRVLAAGGADPTLPNAYGVTPLMVASGLDYWEGETPGPHSGVSEPERLEAVKLAVALGNDVNARADFGDYRMDGDPSYTLLYYPHNIDELVNLGVGDPRWDGCTALHGSIISNQPSITEYLIEQGADVNARNDLGWTPLMMSRGVFLANASREFPAAEAVLLKALDRAPAAPNRDLE